MILKYLLAFICLSAATLSADSCKECRSKYGQKTMNILILEDKEQTHHIAYYLGGCIDTIIEGEDKGWQGIYLLGELVSQSTDVRWKDDGFIHYYDRYKVCSSRTEQWIKYIK